MPRGVLHSSAAPRVRHMTPRVAVACSTALCLAVYMMFFQARPAAPAAGGGHSARGASTILHFTDHHVYADRAYVNHGVAPFPSLQKVLRAAHKAQPRPTTIVLTGDFTNDNTAEAYASVRDEVRGLWGGVPVIYTPGNHEDVDTLHEVLGSEEGWVGPDKATGLLPVTYDISPRWRAVVVNTHIDTHTVPGLVTPEALEALRSELSRAGEEEGMKVMLVLHHPPVPPAGPDKPPWGTMCLLEPEGVLGALEEAGGVVQLALHGHLHTEVALQVAGGAILYGTPSTCHQYETTSDAWGTWRPDEKASAGWREVTLHEDGSHITRVHRA